MPVGHFQSEQPRNLTDSFHDSSSWSYNVSWKLFENFSLSPVLLFTDRQTDKRTDAGDFTSLEEVTSSEPARCAVVCLAWFMSWHCAACFPGGTYMYVFPIAIPVRDAFWSPPSASMHFNRAPRWFSELVQHTTREWHSFANILHTNDFKILKCYMIDQWRSHTSCVRCVRTPCQQNA